MSQSGHSKFLAGGQSATRFGWTTDFDMPALWRFHHGKNWLVCPSLQKVVRVVFVSPPHFSFDFRAKKFDHQSGESMYCRAVQSPNDTQGRALSSMHPRYSKTLRAANSCSRVCIALPLAVQKVCIAMPAATPDH